MIEDDRYKSLLGWPAFLRMFVQMNIPKTLFIAYHEGNSEQLNEIQQFLITNNQNIEISAQFVNVILNPNVDINFKFLSLSIIRHCKLQLNLGMIQSLIPLLNDSNNSLVYQVSLVLGENISNIEEFVFHSNKQQIYGILYTLFHYIEVHHLITQNIFQYLCEIISTSSDIFSIVLSSRCITNFICYQFDNKEDTKEENFIPLFNFILQYFTIQNITISNLPIFIELVPLLSLVPESLEKLKVITFQLSQIVQFCPFPKEIVLNDGTHYSFSTYGIELFKMFIDIVQNNEEMNQISLIPIYIQLCIASEDEYFNWLNDVEQFVTDNINEDIEENTILREDVKEFLQENISFSTLIPYFNNMNNNNRNEETLYYILSTYLEHIEVKNEFPLPTPITNEDPILIGRYFMCCIYLNRQIPEDYINGLHANHFSIPLFISKAIIKKSEKFQYLFQYALKPLTNVMEMISNGNIIEIVKLVNEILFKCINNYEDIIPEYLNIYKNLYIKYSENGYISSEISELICVFLIHPKFYLIIQETFLPIFCEFLFEDNKYINAIAFAYSIFSRFPNEYFVITENIYIFHKMFITFLHHKMKIEQEIIFYVFGILSFFVRINLKEGIEEFFILYSTSKYQKKYIDQRFSDLSISLYKQGNGHTKHNIMNLVIELFQFKTNFNDLSLTNDRITLILTISYIYFEDKRNVDIWLTQRNINFNFLYDMILNSYVELPYQFDNNLYFYFLFTFNVDDEMKIKSFEIYLRHLAVSNLYLEGYKTIHFSEVNPMIRMHPLYEMSNSEFLSFVIGIFPNEYQTKLQKYLPIK